MKHKHNKSKINRRMGVYFISHSLNVHRPTASAAEVTAEWRDIKSIIVIVTVIISIITNHYVFVAARVWQPGSICLFACMPFETA